MAPVVLALLLMQADPGAAPPPAPEPTLVPPERLDEPWPPWIQSLIDRPGPWRHDRLFLRFTAGFGYFTSSARSRTDRWVLRGSNVNLDLAIGWAPIENLVLFADATLDAVGPTTMDARFGPATSRTRAWLASGGGGLAYYFMPANVHVTASLQRGSLSVDRPGEFVGETGAGYCANLIVGWEGWAYEQLGIGLALMVRGARLPDATLASPDARWTALSVTLGLTSTYN